MISSIGIGSERGALRWIGVRAVRSALIAFAFVAAAGCVTAPRIRVPEAAALPLLLSPRADAYVSIDVPSNRALLDQILKRLGVAQKDSSLFVDRTRRLVAVLQRSAGQVSFEAVAFGNYPSWAANFQLTLRHEWKKERDASEPQLSWWAERSGRLELAIPDDGHLLLATGGMPQLYGRVTGTTPPPSEVAVDPVAGARFESAEVAVLIPSPARLLPIEEADAPRFPVRSLLVTLSPTPQAATGPQSHTAGAATEHYAAASLFMLRDERDARLLSVLLRLLAASGAEGASPLAGAVPPLPFSLEGAKVQTDGARLELSNVTLSSTQLDELLSLAFAGGTTGGSP